MVALVARQVGALADPAVEEQPVGVGVGRLDVVGPAGAADAGVLPIDWSGNARVPCQPSTRDVRAAPDRAVAAVAVVAARGDQVVPLAVPDHDRVLQHAGVADQLAADAEGAGAGRVEADHPDRRGCALGAVEAGSGDRRERRTTTGRSRPAGAGRRGRRPGRTPVASRPSSRGTRAVGC